jgi:hypothetical protein
MMQSVAWGQMKRQSLRYCALSAIMVSGQYQHFMKIVSNSPTDAFQSQPSISLSLRKHGFVINIVTVHWNVNQSYCVKKIRIVINSINFEVNYY